MDQIKQNFLVEFQFGCVCRRQVLASAYPPYLLIMSKVHLYSATIKFIYTVYYNNPWNNKKKRMHGEENLVVKRQIPCYSFRILNQNSSIEQFCWTFFTFVLMLRLIIGNWSFFVVFNPLTIIWVPNSEIKLNIKIKCIPYLLQVRKK
jgi:hypothetical protein